MQTKFESFDLSHVPRGENSYSDSLATLATSSVQDFPRVIIVEDLHTPSSLENEVCQVYQIILVPSWMDPISKYLESDILPEEKAEAKKYAGKLLGFGYQGTRSCTDDLFLDCTCSACIPMQHSQS